MPDESTDIGSWFRTIFCALAVGLLFAVPGSVGIDTSQRIGGDGPPEAASVRTVVNWWFAIPGFLVGASIGAAFGALWGRKGATGAIGFLFVTLVGGAIGLTAAGFLGAANTQIVSQTTATGHSVQISSGAPAPVLFGAAVLGLAVGALCARRFGQSKPTGAPPASLPA